MSYHEDYLYHHGIKGMKWGIRRFQNKNGTLTLLGKKRRRAEDDAEDSNGGGKKSTGSKSVKEMSDQELRDRINRLNMERQFLDLNRQVDGLNPKEVSRGEKFVSTFSKEVVPSLTNVGKNLVSSYMEKKGKELLGLSTKDELDTLRKTANELGLKKQIQDLQKSLRGGDKEISTLDVTKLDQYSDTEIANASKRQTNINNILKNWDTYSTTPLRNFYGNDASYKEVVEKGESAVQRALQEMERKNPSGRYN